MKAFKITVFVLSLALAASAYGDTAAKAGKPAQKQHKQNDKSEKKGFKSHFKNPFKHQPKAQEADCRKFPSAAGCPDAKQKQMAKQAGKPEPKTAAMKNGKTMPKKASKPATKKAKKNVKGKKAPVKKSALKQQAKLDN